MQGVASQNDLKTNSSAKRHPPESILFDVLFLISGMPMTDSHSIGELPRRLGWPKYCSRRSVVLKKPSLGAGLQEAEAAPTSAAKTRPAQGKTPKQQQGQHLPHRRRPPADTSIPSSPWHVNLTSHLGYGCCLLLACLPAYLPYLPAYLASSLPEPVSRGAPRPYRLATTGSRKSSLSKQSRYGTGAEPNPRDSHTFTCYTR